MGIDVVAPDWRRDLGEVLIDEASLRARVRELAEQIRADYADREPLLVGVLTGAFVFLADLVRQLDMPLVIGFIRAASYGDRAHSAGRVQVGEDYGVPVGGRHVILVEDIVDTGRTLARLASLFREQQPASLAICCLLDKPGRREVPLAVDYRGFAVPDEFVVGYGLDFAGRYRHLPFVAALRPEAYQGAAEQTSKGCDDAGVG
jgi:hypoxanthine phosphoribosyltransferase